MSPMAQNKTALLVLALVSWPWMADAQPRPVRDWRQWRDTLASEMCSQDTFLVEVEEGSSSPCSTFAESLQNKLTEAEITGRLGKWELAPTEPSQLVVEVEPIFPVRRTSTCLSSEGHLRFFTVRWQKAPGNYVEVPRAAVCETIAAIRQAAELLAQESCAQPKLCGSSDEYKNPTKIRVTRDCPLSAYAIPAYATASMKNWHTDLLGISAPSPALSGQMVLVDSGVDDGWTGITRKGPDPAPRHIHGTAMASVIRKVFPGINITSFRVFDQSGLAGTAKLAKELELLAFHPQRPQVVNLSLGWPPELAYPRLIDKECKIATEDGIGEAVKFALGLLTDDKKTVVFAASGNRSARPFYQQSQTLYQRVPTPARTSTKTGLLDVELREAYYPAQWFTCRDSEYYPGNCGLKFEPRTRKVAGADGWRPLTVPVWSVDDERKLTSFSRKTLSGSGLRLAAPGQQVYVDLNPPGADPQPYPNPPFGCTAAETFVKNNLGKYYSPMPFTGSSISTAMTSAAVVWTQAQVKAKRNIQLNAVQATALTILTGNMAAEEATYLAAEGATYRSPSLCRVNACINNSKCWASTPRPGGAGACVKNRPNGSLASILKDCHGTWVPALGCPNSLPIQFNEIRFMPFAGTLVPFDFKVLTSALARSCSPVSANKLTTLRTIPWYGEIAGRFGPQPASTGCPPCVVWHKANDPKEVHLALDFNPAFAGGNFTEVRVEIVNDSDEREQFMIYQAPTGGGEWPWAPGGQVNVSLTLKAGPPKSAVLYIKSQKADAWDVSVLKVIP